MFIPFPPLLYLIISPNTNKFLNAVKYPAIIFCCGSLLAISTELIQGILTYRSCDINDLYADLFALVVSSFFVCTLMIKKYLL